MAVATKLCLNLSPQPPSNSIPPPSKTTQVSWYTTGKHPIGADKIDYARDRLAHAAHDMKEKAEQLGHQAQQQIKGT